jgi:hypothetical protein
MLRKYREEQMFMKRSRGFAGMLTGAAALALSGCVMINSSSIGNRGVTGQGVTGVANGWGILRLTVPEGLTTSANSQLASACPSGKFTNPQTELQMRDFIVVQYYTVIADAVCD